MLSKEEIQLILVLAETFFNQFEEYKEDPFPKCSSNELDKLFQCCERSESLSYDEDLDIYYKLAKLIYNVCKGHFLHNGNKRAATLVFIAVVVKKDLAYIEDLLLSSNGLRNMEKIIDIVVSIARSNPNERDEIIEKTKKDFRAILEPLHSTTSH